MIPVDYKEHSFLISLVLLTLLKLVSFLSWSFIDTLIKWHLLHFRYYGIGLWLPELFNRFENHQSMYPNQTATVCQLMHESSMENVVMTSESIFVESSKTVQDCNPNMDKMVFINSLTINAFCLLGNIVSGYMADRVGRRTMPGKLKKNWYWIK